MYKNIEKDGERLFEFSSKECYDSFVSKQLKLQELKKKIDIRRRNRINAYLKDKVFKSEQHKEFHVAYLNLTFPKWKRKILDEYVYISQ